jgi:maltose/moltooligosaccharide transporter
MTPLPKPRMTFWQIWNMSFGFMGIQLGFALQNSNASGILRNYGAEIEQLSWFWLAAPIVGMIVQPIVGHYSDRTWNRLGRRKPYFLAGALFSSCALILMPNAWILGSLAPLMFIGAGFLMIMDASFNLAMEPFRALVADNLPEEQRTLGFSVQTSLIGVGAVVGSWLPWALARFGVSDTAPDGEVAPNVQFAFYIGAVLFILTILWTVMRTHEFSPEDYERYHGKSEDRRSGLLTIFRDFSRMPRTMRQLGLVQFFSWFALFGMWVFTTDTIATHIFGLPVTDRSSPAYREAQSWTGIIFGVYNLVSAIYALFLAKIAARIGRKKTHAFSLILGGIGLLSFYFAPNKEFLILSMVLVGIAWASILAMPYVILSSSIPAGKMGIYMGIFNFFITIPQILNGLIGGPMVRHIYNNEPVYALVLSGIFFISAAVSVIFVYDPVDLRGKPAGTVPRTI